MATVASCSVQARPCRAPMKAGRCLALLRGSVRQTVPAGLLQPAGSVGVRSRALRGIRTVAAAAQQTAVQLPQALRKNTGGDVFVLGGASQLGARIVKELLQAGFKITAAVEDEEEAAGIVEFAKRFELITSAAASKLRLTEVDFSDADEIAEAIPRGATVLVESRGRSDVRLVERALAAAVEMGASRFVLVTPAAGGGGGLFGGGGGAGQLSKVEQDVVDSGLEVLVVRTGRDVEDGFAAESNIVAGPLGSLAGAARVAKTQVADAVAELLQQVEGSAVVEVAADPTAEFIAIDELIAQVLPEAVIETAEPAAEEAEEEEEKEEEEEEEEEKQAAPSPVASLFSFGRRARAATVQEEEEEDEEEEEEEAAPPKPGFSFGNFLAKPPAVPQDVEEEEEEKQSKPLFGFGTRKVKAAPPPAEEQSKPAFGFGTRKVKAQADGEAAPKSKPLFGFGGRQQKQEPEPAKPRRGFSLGTRSTRPAEDSSPKPRPAFSFGPRKGNATEEPAPSRTGFTFGTRKAKAGQRTEPQKSKPAFGFGTRKVKTEPAARPAAKAGRKQAEEAPKKKKGFLELLGVSSETVYADE